MTREAKIGLLTGLGVIVLIGVLLSEYLGGPAPGTAAGQNRMAALPIGSSYREHVMQPAGVPGMVPSEGATGSPASGPLVNQIGGLPTAYAANPSTPALATSSDAAQSNAASGEVAIAPAVTPIADGQVSTLRTSGYSDRPPTIQLNDLRTISAAPAGQPSPTAATPAVKGEQYVIAAGDTLGKIAKKFYHSSKVEDQQRIVAANPGVLKNTGTMLMIGKPLIIPGVAAVKVAGAADRKADARTDGRSQVVIRSPGQAEHAAGNADSGARRLTPAAEVARKDVMKTPGAKNGGLYVVQDGDTLGSIARKVSPSHASQVARQIAVLNKIKDPRGLQVGQKLRLPAM